jgi:hypothetical protein
MQEITLSQYVDLRYLILGFTEKGYGIYKIPGVLETWGVFNEYDRLRLLGEIILNVSNSYWLSFNIEKYFEDLKKYQIFEELISYWQPVEKFIKSYSDYSGLINFIILIKPKVAFFKLGLDGFVSALRFFSKNFNKFKAFFKKPILINYIKPYAIHVYLWLIRAGIELKKYPQTKDFNEIAIASFKRLLYHVENDIWGMEFSQGISERDLAIEALKVLFQRITPEEFLKLIYKKDTKKLAEILELDEKIVRDTFHFWESVPIPPGILNN